jgi:hypothetical protein
LYCAGPKEHRQTESIFLNRQELTAIETGFALIPIGLALFDLAKVVSE